MFTFDRSSCWENAKNFAYFGLGVNLLELVFEFFAKAFEQTIVFSNFFHKLFRVNFTFHLVKTHASVKNYKQLVVMVSCRLQCCTLENIVLWDTFQSHDRRTMFIYDRTRSQTIATDRTNRTWLYSCNRLRSRSHSIAHDRTAVHI